MLGQGRLCIRGGTMKIKELEHKELRQRIFKQVSNKLWYEAIEIHKTEIGFENFGWYKRLCYSPFGKDMRDVKDIQMKLLDKEVDDALVEVEE